MHLIERLSNGIASKMAASLGVDKDQEEILAYGAFGIMQTLWSILLVAIFGLIFKVFYEAMVLSFSASLLRKYSGGAHADSPNRCAIIGVIIFVGFALLIRFVENFIVPIYLLLFIVICFSFSYYIMVKLSPVDSPNKPINDASKRLILKRGSIYFITFELCLAVLFFVIHEFTSYNLYNIILSICIGMSWQSLMLTSVGHQIINYIDIFLFKICRIS